MKLQGTWMLPVILLLVAGVAGCGEEPQQAADEPKPDAAEPGEGQEAAVAEIEKLGGRVFFDETSPDRPVTPTRDQAVGVLSEIQSAIEAGVVWRHEPADGKRLLNEIQSAIEAGEQHSKDFEAEVNVLKHFHRAPEWDGKQFKEQAMSLLGKRALSAPVIKELSQDGAWGRADELFDKDRLRRRVALHDVKADDCYALVLKNGKAETIFHWNGKTLAILHYSEPAVRESLDKFLAHEVREKQSNWSGALSHNFLQNLGPLAESAIPAISKLLTHDDRWHRIQAAITLWKIDRRSSVSVPPLINMLADTKLAVRNRAMAAEGLGIIGPQASDAKATLFAAMGEKQSRLRVSAAWALWKTTGDSKSTRPVLLDLLKDDNLNVFSIAAKTLGEMGWDKESLAALVAAVEADSDRTFSMRRLTQKLVEALISDDVEIRKEALVALSKIGEPEKLVRDALKNGALEDKDLEAVLKATADDDAGVRSAASAALARYADSRATQALLKTMADTEATVRTSAARAAGSHPAEVVAEPLLELLDDPESRVAVAAASSLGRLRSEQAVPRLKELESGDDKPLAAAAIDALKAIGVLTELEAAIRKIDVAQLSPSEFKVVAQAKGKRVVRKLIAAMQSPQFSRNTRIAQTLGQIGDPDAVQPLINQLMYGNYRNAEVPRALGKLGDKRAIEPLLQSLTRSSGSSPYRRALQESLLMLDAPGILDQLASALKERRNQYEARQILEVLGQAGGNQAVAVVAPYLDDAQVCRYAASALLEINSDEALEEIKKRLRDKDYPHAQMIVARLRRMPTRPSQFQTDADANKTERIAVLLENLGDSPHPAVQSYVRSHLASLEQRSLSKELVPALIGKLQNKDPDVRNSAALALRRIGPAAKNAVPALIKALQDDDEFIRWTAAEALGSIGPAAKDAVPALIKALEDRDRDVGKWAAYALGKIGPAAKDAVPDLIKAMQHEDSKVRRAAVDALSQIRIIGSEDTSQAGGATYYPKAQSFVAPAAQVQHVALHMRNAFAGTWQVRIVTSLPRGGARGKIDQADLDAKTLGSAQVSGSSAGWVDFYLPKTVALTPGKTYFLFIDSHDVGELGPGAQWSTSVSGPFPGTYPDGTGWIFVYRWSDNSNAKESFEVHHDYAFRIYYDDKDGAGNVPTVPEPPTSEPTRAKVGQRERSQHWIQSFSTSLSAVKC